MITIILFIAGTALVGGLGYLAIRPLILGHWSRWQKDRRQDRAIRMREHQQQALREEATQSVLEQLARQEESRRGTGRKAA